MPQIVLETLPETLMIHRLPATYDLAQVLASLEPAQSSRPQGSLFATLSSREELSIVCDAAFTVGKTTGENTGVEVRSSGPWRAMRVMGELDFALTGILSGLAAPLADAEISLFAISSFDTDYLLVNARVLEQAISVLKAAGYRFAAST